MNAYDQPEAHGETEREDGLRIIAAMDCDCDRRHVGHGSHCPVGIAQRSLAAPTHDLEALREALIALNRNVGDLANSAVQAKVERALSTHVGDEG